MRHLAMLLLAWATVAAADAPPKDTMAVMDFNPANASASDAATLSGFIRGAVVRSDKFLVVEKKNMDKILAEQAFQQTGCTSSECAVKLGKILNARKMIVGEYTVLDGVRFLTASLVDVETGQIERTAKVKDFDLRSADEAADRLVAKLTGVRLAADDDTSLRAAPPRRPRGLRTRFSLAAGARNHSLTTKTDFTGASMQGLPHTGTYAGASAETTQRTLGADLTAEYWRAFSETSAYGFGVLAGIFGGTIHSMNEGVTVMGTPTTGQPVQFKKEPFGGDPGPQGEIDVFWNVRDWCNVLAGVHMASVTFSSDWGAFNDGTGSGSGTGSFGSGPLLRKTAYLTEVLAGVELFPFEHFSARISVAFGPGATMHFDAGKAFNDVGGTSDYVINPSPVLTAKAVVSF